MLKDREDIIKLAKKFVTLCEKNKIWYSVDNGTMLGTVRENGMIPWDDDFDVMMTPQSFLILKKLFPNNIIDMDEKGYPLLIPKFMNDKNDFLKSAVFVDIFLIVNTNLENIKKYRSLKNKTRFAFQTIHSAFYAYNFGSKFFKFISYPFKKFPSKITTDEAINILKTPNKTDIYFTIDNPIDPFKINFQKNISFKTVKMKFEGINLNVSIEYDSILKQKYGNNYMTPNKNVRKIEHINAISIKKVNRKKF